MRSEGGLAPVQGYFILGALDLLSENIPMHSFLLLARLSLSP